MKYKTYNFEDFKKLKDVGMLTSMCLDMVETSHIRKGVTTHQIDSYVAKFAITNNMTCATLGYRGFPASCCTSVNHVACHGIPSKDKVLKDGDIIKVDVTFIKDGYFGDSCRTFIVGEGSRKAKKIVDIARQALSYGMAEVMPGNHIGDIGLAIETWVKSQGASIVREFVGHGIGKMFHDGPEIPHFCSKHNVKKTPELVPGMVFTIEPIVNLGEPKLKILKDGWTAVTRDRSLSAQFEHTIGITDFGYEVFTR